MSLIEPAGFGNFRSYNVKPPSWARMDALYGEYEDRFGDPARRPYPAHLAQHQSVFLSERFDDGVLVRRGVPIWELIWGALHHTKATGGLVFRSNGRLDLAYYARMIGCSEECLQPFDQIFRDFESIDPNVPAFGYILRAKLAEDIANGELITYPDGRVKARANGKPIVVHLKTEDPAISSIDWLKNASSVLEDAAGDEDKKYLFLMRIGSNVQLMTPHWFTDWAKSLASSIPTLERITFLPSMIRPSILLRAALENDGRLQVGAALGQHGMTTTERYQGRLPVRQIYTSQIREFQNHFEKLTLFNIEGIARFLRVSEEELARRIEGLTDTGLGVFCKNNYGRPGNEGKPCGEFDCTTCPQILIVAEVEQVAALRLWQESLEAGRGIS